MDSISNVDRLITLLRQRMQEKDKLAWRKRGGSVRGEEPIGVRALAGVANIDDRALGRALIQNLLADRFGSGVINDARFQQVVDQVTTSLQDDREGSKLLSKAISELRRPPG